MFVVGCVVIGDSCLLRFCNRLFVVCWLLCICLPFVVRWSLFGVCCWLFFLLLSAVCAVLLFVGCCLRVCVCVCSWLFVVRGCWLNVARCILHVWPFVVRCAVSVAH